MIITLIGWLAAITVLFAFGLNAYKKTQLAFLAWIVGDVLWIIYDISINNPSHCFLSLIIILINCVGWYKLNKI